MQTDISALKERNCGVLGSREHGIVQSTGKRARVPKVQIAR